MPVDATTQALKSLRPRFIYFARVGDYLKVGCSIDPRKRVHTIRKTDGPLLDLWAPTELIRFVPAGPSVRAFGLEGDYMAALADYHVEGEWFRATPEVLDWIAALDPELRPHEQRPIARPAA